MTERQKNIVTGLVVLSSLCILGWLIVTFTKLPQLFHSGYTLMIDADNTYGLKSGDYVYMKGSNVGMIDRVGFKDEDPNNGICIVAKIDSDKLRLKTNLKAIITSNGGFIGNQQRLNLVFDGELATDPETSKTIEYYDISRPIILKGRYHEQSLITLPRELTETLNNFGKLAESLHTLIGPPDEDKDRPEDPSKPKAGLKGTVDRMNRTLDSIYAITGDKANQKHLKASLKNLNSLSSDAGDLTRQLITSAEKLDKFLISITGTVEKIKSGKGSAGKLLNDPELYNNLEKSASQMDQLLKELRQLVSGWKTKGIKINIK